MFLIFIFFWLEPPGCGILILNRYTEERNHAMDTIYDVIILGAGPSGLSAAIYAGRGRLKTLLLEQGQDGGQIAIKLHLNRSTISRTLQRAKDRLYRCLRYSL